MVCPMRNKPGEHPRSDLVNDQIGLPMLETGRCCDIHWILAKIK
jgi:hypothetical protein